MKQFSKIKSEIMKLSLPIGMMIVTAYPEHDIIFANDKFCQMLGFVDENEPFQTVRRSAWDCVYPEDIPRLREASAGRNVDSESYEITYRAVKKDGSLIWVNQCSQHMIGDNGEELIYAYYTDMTLQKRMEATIRADANKYETLIHSIPGGVGMYHINAEFTPIFISNRVYELCGMTKEQYERITAHSTLDIFHPDDRGGLRTVLETAYQENHKFEYTHRVLQSDGNYRWMRVSGQVMDQPDGTPVLYTIFTDIHEQVQAERALRESESRYMAAVRSANINIGEYEYATDSMDIFSTSIPMNPKTGIILNYVQTVVSEEHLREDCIPLLLDVIERLKKGEKEITADLWIRQHSTDEFWCERVIYTNEFDEDGKPVKVYCVGRDITKEKEAEKRYRDELSYREAMQKATMASINMNLTQNTILDYKSNFEEVTFHMSIAKTAQDYFDQVCRELTTEKMKERHQGLFNRDALIRHFMNGTTTLSTEYTRRIEGRIYWVRVTGHMMKKENGDIVVFLYSTDVTNERTMQNMMNAIVRTDYDFLVVVDAMRNSAIRYSEKDLGNHYAYKSEFFEPDTQDYVRRYICVEDAGRVASELTLQNILAQLETKITYSIFYGMPNATGGVSNKQLRFSYINRELKSILMTRVDITAAVKEQERKNQELLAAVEMAEHANAVKSDFLSRISHEIRTPMNAIMGMEQLVMQCPHDPGLVSACMEKSQYASRYLLQLLNDILDMSKIESGKVTFKTEVIACQPFLDAIGTIVETQAVAKGVQYVVTQFDGCRCSYLGDGVRLQQILINILTNAVKFTPPGGTVRLDITQRSVEEKTEHICFTISDTGIGIGKAFLPELFRPFSQEYSGIRSGYGGSGLGLAISKNLVELMGGNIEVESVQGRGTIFRVEIPFGIPRTDSVVDGGSDTVGSGHTYDFSGKKILLVEDHELNIMVARKLLEFKNADVEVAVNGQIGLTMFADAPAHTYDAILMDIRMPVMDGLESAMAIRKLDSPWAKAVPIIAMSANAFHEDVVKSQNAGMNAHLAKPIEGALLYETLYELMSKSDGKAEESNE